MPNAFRRHRRRRVGTFCRRLQNLGVLNALRRHRRCRTPELQHHRPRRECSTPFGVIVGVARYRLAAIPELESSQRLSAPSSASRDAHDWKRFSRVWVAAAGRLTILGSTLTGDLVSAWHTTCSNRSTLSFNCRLCDSNVRAARQRRDCHPATADRSERPRRFSSVGQLPAVRRRVDVRRTVASVPPVRSVRAPRSGPKPVREGGRAGSRRTESLALVTTTAIVAQYRLPKSTQPSDQSFDADGAFRDRGPVPASSRTGRGSSRS